MTNPFEQKMADLRAAEELVLGARLVGRALGAILALLPWWLSHAPWWAVPVFALVVGWIGGAVYASYVDRVMFKELMLKYPEVSPRV